MCRLSETFKGISTSSQKTMEALRTVVSKDGDFKHYREALSMSPPPTLPYFESVLEEMWFLECSSPKVLSGGIVNFFHYRQIARKVFTYQQCLPTPCIHSAPLPRSRLARSCSHSHAPSLNHSRFIQTSTTSSKDVKPTSG